MVLLTLPYIINNILCVGSDPACDMTHSAQLWPIRVKHEEDIEQLI